LLSGGAEEKYMNSSKLVAGFAYSSALKMETVLSSKTTVNIYPTARFQNSEDRTVI
jgi:hypothetical protein